MSTEGNVLGLHSEGGPVLAVRGPKRGSSENPNSDLKEGGLVVPQVSRVLLFMDYEIAKVRDFQMEGSSGGLKESSLMAPAPGLPDMTKPFHLYVSPPC